MWARKYVNMKTNENCVPKVDDEKFIDLCRAEADEQARAGVGTFSCDFRSLIDFIRLKNKTSNPFRFLFFFVLFGGSITLFSPSIDNLRGVMVTSIMQSL